MSTHYEILGIAQDASQTEIKRAYHRIMLEHHPDKNPHIPESEKLKHEAISKEANNAWAILGDPQKRKEYDEVKLRPAKRQKRDEGEEGYWSRMHEFFSFHNYSSWFESSSDEDSTPRSPSPPPPPKRYPRSLDINSHDWNMSIELRGDYEPYEWGPGSVYCEENKIFIYTKIRASEHANTFREPHVSIKISTTPGMQRVHKIESLYKHRMQPEGIDEQLLVTVFLEPRTGHQFSEMRQYNREEMSFDFWWDVHANQPDSGSRLKPPEEVITHATCLHFFTRRPCQKATFVPKSEHPDNPRSVLLRDSDLRPAKSLNFVGTGGQERSWIPIKSVTRGTTKMYQIAACTWQGFGQGKGERGKAAKGTGGGR